MNWKMLSLGIVTLILGIVIIVCQIIKIQQQERQPFSYYDKVDYIYIGVEGRDDGGYNLWIHQYDKDNHQLGYAFCIATSEIEKAIEEYEKNKIKPNQ